MTDLASPPFERIRIVWSDEVQGPDAPRMPIGIDHVDPVGMTWRDNSDGSVHVEGTPSKGGGTGRSFRPCVRHEIFDGCIPDLGEKKSRLIILEIRIGKERGGNSVMDSFHHQIVAVLDRGADFLHGHRRACPEFSRNIAFFLGAVRDLKHPVRMIGVCIRSARQIQIRGAETSPVVPRIRKKGNSELLQI